MKDWVEWISARDVESDDKRLWLTGRHYGDWLTLDNRNAEVGATDRYDTASA
jgi:hypothetical protein